MSLNNPVPGGLSSSEFLVSPVPWVTSSTVSGINKYNFKDANIPDAAAADMTYISRWIRITNKGGTPISVAFTLNGFAFGNFFALAANETFQADLRLAGVFLSGSGQSFNIVAGLTGIQARHLPVLSASQGFPGVG